MVVAQCSLVCPVRGDGAGVLVVSHQLSDGLAFDRRQWHLRHWPLIEHGRSANREHRESTPLHERRSRPESAAGEPTPLSVPQAGIFRSGPRATRFAAAALLSSLGSRSCCSQQRSSSTACRSRACERASLLFTSCFRFFAFPARRERGPGAHERRQCGRSGAGRASSHGAPVGCAGRRRPCPNGAPLEIFGRVARREEAAGASRWGLGSENRPSRRWALNTGCQAPGI